MQYELKALSKEALPMARERARTYRLLNEPSQAESICRDILRVDPDDVEALILLVLSLTDQFDHGLAGRFARAQEIVVRLPDDYRRCYYSGIVCERRARAHLRQNIHNLVPVVHEWLERAMGWYEKAEQIRPKGNDEALLRWNSCARTIMDHKLTPVAETRFDPLLE